MRFFYSIIMVLFFTVFTVNAGVEINFSVENHMSNSKHNNTIYLTDDNFAINDEKNQQTAIFIGGQDKFYIINHSKKEYFEMTKADIDKITQQIKNAMKMMDEQLANVPEAQREQMKQMMGDNMPGADAMEMVFEYRATSEKENINGYNTTKYEVFLNGEKDNQELWVTDYSNIDVKASDFVPFTKFNEYMKEIFESIGSAANIQYDMFWDMNSLNGVPIKTVNLSDNGSVEETTVLQSVSRKSLSNDLFEAPKKYKKKKMNLD